MKTVLEVQNIRCSGCANTISNRLERIHGVRQVDVTPDKDQVSIIYINKRALQAALTKLTKLGYPLASDKNSFSQKASSLVSCAFGRMSK